EKQLKERILSFAADGQLDGQRYRAKIVSSFCSRTNWRTIAEKLGPSRQLLAAHTTKQERVSIRLTARPQPMVQVYPEAG
ncbi:MAG: hypothetical protein ACYTBZ_26400, partial [Planctomycetota bacterium]